jgi:GNAT superfamily N-acetyltransferase
MSGDDPPITYRSVTRARLKDLERFSEGHGKFRYCSCMRWRLASTEFQRSTKDERVERLDRLVRGGEAVGVLAYADGEPIGWCSIAPRTQFEALARSRALQPVDETPVWSIVCFFVDRGFRRRGVTLGLLKAAVDHAASRGAQVVESYPVETGARLYTYLGSYSTFKRAGFRDVTPKGRKRRIMRLDLQKR